MFLAPVGNLNTTDPYFCNVLPLRSPLKTKTSKFIVLTLNVEAAYSIAKKIGQIFQRLGTY